MYTAQLIFYKQGEVPSAPPECSSLDTWVWFMNAFIGINLLINGLLTIYVRWKGPQMSEDFVKKMEKGHFLCLFCVIIWVLYS